MANRIRKKRQHGFHYLDVDTSWCERMEQKFRDIGLNMTKLYWEEKARIPRYTAAEKTW
jgi:hypothetical protein